MPKRLSNSGIDYLTHTWNFISGCKHWQDGTCEVAADCWAKQTVERFPDYYKNGFNPTFHPEALESPCLLREPARIGVVFMGDLFGDWVFPDKVVYKGSTLKHAVFSVINRCPQHTFIFLTKAFRNLEKWSPFPSNCWVGISAPRPDLAALEWLSGIECGLRFLSVEPMFEEWPAVAFDAYNIGWIIVGSCTGSYENMSKRRNKYPEMYLSQVEQKWSLQPPSHWVANLKLQAQEQKIPFYMKNNLSVRTESVKEFPSPPVSTGRLFL